MHHAQDSSPLAIAIEAKQFTFNVTRTIGQLSAFEGSKSIPDAS